MKTEYKTTIDAISLKKVKSDFKKIKITDSKSASEYVRGFYHQDIEIYESVFILLLNRANVTIGYAKISQGGVCSSVVDPVIVAKYAIDTLAKGVILVHNHPSGNLNPSENDIAITEKVKRGLSLFDCNLIDHLIITEDGYYSLADNGII